MSDRIQIQLTLLLMSVVLITGAFIMRHIGGVGESYILIIFAVVCLSISYGIKDDGYNRLVWKKLGYNLNNE